MAPILWLLIVGLAIVCRPVAVSAQAANPGRAPIPARLGLYGLSTGGGFAAAVASTDASIRALITDGGTLVALASNALGLVKNLGAPLLILQGEADTQVSPNQAREYERAARAAGKSVDAHYYPSVGHVVILPTSSPPDIRDAVQADVLARSIAFFKQHLAATVAAAPDHLPNAGDGPAPTGATPVSGAIGAVMLVLGLTIRRRWR
jgi:fermentation-respiration switch protein FrsA (DUF1100 family)